MNPKIVNFLSILFNRKCPLNTNGTIMNRAVE